MSKKFLVACTIGQPEDDILKALREQVAEISKVFPGEKLPPHITLHRPVTGVEEVDLLGLIAYLLKGEKIFEVATGRPNFFGREMFVLPLESQTQALSRLWVGLHQGILNFPGQKQGEYDRVNTLHVTLGKGLSQKGRGIRYQLGELLIPRLVLSLPKVVVYVKTADGTWEILREFKLAAS